VAAVGHLWGPNPDRGVVYKSIDGGKNWQKVLFLNEDTGAIDIAIDLESPNTLYAAMYQRSRSAFEDESASEFAATLPWVIGGPNADDNSRISQDLAKSQSRLPPPPSQRWEPTRPGRDSCFAGPGGATASRLRSVVRIIHST
jgi:hypothetical protein